MTSKAKAAPQTPHADDNADVSAAHAEAANTEMDRLVTAAEHDLAQRDQAQWVDLIDAGTRGVLTLFPYRPRTLTDGKTYPAMTGYLDTRAAKIKVAAFLKFTEEGRQFLSLSIGAQGQQHIGGAVFRQEAQDPKTGFWALAPGKANDRHGVIAKTALKAGSTDEYETQYQLRFYGKRRVSGTGVPYIKAQVYPERKDHAETPEAMAGCF